jgi:SHS2 domain-containing protein
MPDMMLIDVKGRCLSEQLSIADIGVRGWGSTPAEAFAQAALALTAVVTDLKTVDAAEPAGLPTKVARLQPIICIKG